MKEENTSYAKEQHQIIQQDSYGGLYIGNEPNNRVGLGGLILNTYDTIDRSARAVCDLILLIS